MGISTSPSVWRGDKGGQYCIRRIGDVVWWVCMQKDGSRASSFRGLLTANTVKGQWAELWPAKTSPAAGNLALSLSSNHVIDVTGQTGGFKEKRLTLEPGGQIFLPFP